MKLSTVLILAVLAASFSWAASDWSQRVGDIAPTGIVVADVIEGDGYITITGTATGTADVSALMRQVQKSELGAPELQSVKKIDELSHFILRVKLKR